MNRQTKTDENKFLAPNRGKSLNQQKNSLKQRLAKDETLDKVDQVKSPNKILEHSSKKTGNL